MKHIPTTATAVGKIKARAKQLREQHSSMGHARDAAAKEAGYYDFHHVTACAAREDIGIPKPDTPHLVACAIHVLPGLIEAEPYYLRSLGASHAAANHSFGLHYLCAELKSIHRAGGEQYFKDACDDYLANIRIAEFDVTPDAAFVSSDMASAQSIWNSLLTEEHAAIYRSLLNHAFAKMLSGYSQGSRNSLQSNENRMTCQLLLETADRLFRCTDMLQLDKLDEELSGKLLPRNMNVNLQTGEDDYTTPSTYWSRIASVVSFEMAGYVGALPITRIMECVGNLANVSLEPTVVPRDPEVQKRFLDTSLERAAMVVVPAIQTKR